MPNETASTENKFTALIFSPDVEGIGKIRDMLEKRGINVLDVDSFDQLIDQMKRSAPDILIAEDDFQSDVGLKAIREALNISWMISSILVSNLDEKEIHDKTEGLGILGSITALDDSDKLASLIDVFEKLHSK